MALSTKTTFIASTFPENPLKTADFSPPASSCSGIYLTNNVYAIDNDSKCLPNKFNGASTAFYSPGTVCPTGYTAQPQCSRNGGVRSITTVTCCPYRGDMTLSCVEDDMTLANVWETQFCTWMAGPATVVDITRTDNGVVATQAVTMSDRDGVNAWGIRMVYQASDLVPKTTSGASIASATATGTAAAGSGATSGASATGTAAGADNTSGSATGAATSGASSGGLSTGGIVAVAVVVPVVAIAALVGLFLWWRRRKHRYAGVKPAETPTAPEMDGSSAMGSQSAYAYQNQQYAQQQHNGQYPQASPPASEMIGTDMAGYYNNDKVLMNPGGQHQGAGHTQYKGYTHPQPPVELASGDGPTELPADNDRR